MRPWLLPSSSLLLPCQAATVVLRFVLIGLVVVPSLGHNHHGEVRPFSWNSLVPLGAHHCSGSEKIVSRRSTSSSRRLPPLSPLLASARHRRKTLECLESGDPSTPTSDTTTARRECVFAHAPSSRDNDDTTDANALRRWTAVELRGGGQYFIPAGWNPFGYKITTLGETFLAFDGSLDSDVGRFLASLKTTRKRFATLKGQWLEVLRVSKTGQSMRIYKQLNELLQFCLQTGLID